jgi:predicted MFS family arabinose efflux permease
MNKTRSTKSIPALGVLCALLFGICLAARSYFIGAPFSVNYTLDGPSGVFPGIGGRTFIIDKGKKLVLLTDERGVLSGTISCGRDSSGAHYYASLAAEGTDGSIYVADVLYAGMGTRIRQERIVRYDRNGRGGSLIYAIDYTEAENMPLQYGNILSMREEHGFLVLSVRTPEGLSVRRVSVTSGETQSVEYRLPGQYISDADVVPGTMLPVFTNRIGQLCTVGRDGQASVLADEGRTSWMLCAEQDGVYYTDLAANEVLYYDFITGEEQTVIHGESIIYAVQAQGGDVCATDYAGCYILRDGRLRYMDTLPCSAPVLRCVLWTVLFAGILLLLCFIYIVLIRILRGKKRSETFSRMIIVLCVSLCVGGLASYIAIDSMIRTQRQTVMEQLNLFNDILVQSVEPGLLEQIDSLDDYRGDVYMRIKEPLDRLTALTYNSNTYYYYIVYVTDGKIIYGIMDYEDTMTARHPMYKYGTPGYTETLAGGTVQEVSGEVSSYGSWSFVIKPVRNSEGIPVASIEVGVNLDYLDAQYKALSLEILMTVLSAAVVLIMLIMEILFYVEYREKRGALTSDMPAGLRFPLRTLLFLTFLADCMQDAFISILASQRYRPVPGIPQSVGAAVPLSAQVLFTALSAFAGGFITRGIGVKKTLLSGFLLQISGFLLCGSVPDYLGLLGGKCLIGAGMGLIIVGTNSLAAGCDGQEESGRAFAAISAGTLAGVTAGAGIGSIILSFGSFSLVYYMGAALLVPAIPLIIAGSDWRERRSERRGGTAGLLRFLSDGRVLGFLLLILLPFLMALSYREYFFPLYAAEMGISETMIGRVYLVCGLFIIYAGPILTNKLLSRLGGKRTMALASLLMSLAPLLFVISPSVPAAAAGIVLLSLSISFGYAAQSTYYSGLPGVAGYGESRAMGVYSLFDNGGQTIGPIVYGIAMTAGYRTGLLIIGSALAALLGLFLLCSRHGSDVYKGD